MCCRQNGQLICWSWGRSSNAWFIINEWILSHIWNKLLSVNSCSDLGQVTRSYLRTYTCFSPFNTCLSPKIASSYRPLHPILEEVPIMNTYSCDSCGKTYKTLANLKRLLDDNHSDKLFQCETFKDDRRKDNYVYYPFSWKAKQPSCNKKHNSGHEGTWQLYLILFWPYLSYGCVPPSLYIAELFTYIPDE
jgi:hypothetical protein